MTFKIDESTDFNALILMVTPSGLIDLSPVNHINSIGTKRWIDFFSKYRPEPRFENISPCLVDQMNLIPNFIKNRQVSSILAPLICEECGNESKLKISLEGAKAGKFNFGACPQCGSRLELDDFEEEFFKFSARPE